MFFTSAVTAALAFSHAALASPHPKANAFGAKSYLAKFDDLIISPASAIPIGNYQGLNYNSFFVNTQATTGPQPQSPLNTAAYGLYGMALQGTPYITPINSGAFLDLDYFYFGCALQTAGTAASVPTSCTLTATGYIGSQKIGSQTFKYTVPNGAITTPMQFAKFNSWAVGLTRVEFDTADDTLLGTIFDNFKYTVYGKQ